MNRWCPCKEQLVHFLRKVSAMNAEGRIPTFSGIVAAAGKLSHIVPATPLLTFTHGESTIFAKDESAQPVRAFKLRGAWHRLSDLDADQRSRGVVAFSSGNHALGVAWAAQRLGLPAAIVMPRDTPAIKLEGTRALGAEVILYDRMTESREKIAAALASERGAVLVPSFNDPWIVEGQGSAGLEAATQMGEAPDLVVAPCGGGGLASGLALALPDSRIVVVEPEGWDDMGESLRRGYIVPVAPNPPLTRCDALQTLRVAPLTFGILSDRGATGVAVSESETEAAMRFAWQTWRLTLEPGGAVALGAILSGKVMPGERTLVILSGGNVDPVLFGRVAGE
jgi:threonine dehydratase